MLNNAAYHGAVYRASSGLGMELAKLFYHRGFNLVLVARRQAPLEDLRRQLYASCGSVPTASTFANLSMVETMDPNGAKINILLIYFQNRVGWHTSFFVRAENTPSHTSNYFRFPQLTEGRITSIIITGKRRV